MLIGVTVIDPGNSILGVTYQDKKGSSVKVEVAGLHWTEVFEPMDDPSDVGPRVSRDLAEDAIATVREIVECWTEQRDSILFSDQVQRDHEELARDHRAALLLATKTAA